MAAEDPPASIAAFNSKSKSPTSPQLSPRRGYGSYAILSKLREGYATVGTTSKAQRQVGSLDNVKSNASLDLTPRSTLSASSGPSYSQTIKAWPTRDVAILQAELALMREKNQALTTLLQNSEQRLKELEQRDSSWHLGMEAEVQHLQQKLEAAEAEKRAALLVAGKASGEAESIRQTMAAQFLHDSEVEEAHLKQCWLSHYWDLAAKHGVLPEISAARAASWQCKPSADAAMRAAAMRYFDDINEFNTQVSNIQISTAQDQTSSASRHEPGQDSKVHPRQLRTVADYLEVERGMREAAELRLQAAVTSTLAELHQKQQMASNMPSDVNPQHDVAGLAMSSISEDEAAEVRFQATWLTYLWSRAAALDIEPSIAEQRARFWAGALTRKATTGDLVLLHHAVHEVSSLGLEQQLWELRYNA